MTSNTVYLQSDPLECQDTQEHLKYSMPKWSIATWTDLVKYCIFVVNVGDSLQKCYFSAGLKALAHVLLIVISEFNTLSSSWYIHPRMRCMSHRASSVAPHSSDVVCTWQQTCTSLSSVETFGALQTQRLPVNLLTPSQCSTCLLLYTVQLWLRTCQCEWICNVHYNER
jgi:hypothetical protein